MPKATDEQIRRDFAAMPWLKQAAVAADDVVRIGASGLTFGISDTLNGESGAEDLRAARVRAGLAGDVANVGGQVFGAGKALQAGKAAYGIARALPTAASLVGPAGLGTAVRYATGKAGPGLVPAVTRSAPSLGTIAKAAGVAGLLGLSVAGRQNPEVAVKPATKPVVKDPVAESLAQGRAAGPTITPQVRQLAALDTILKSPNMTISDLQAVTGMLPAPDKPRTLKDTAFGRTAELSRQIFESQIASIGAQKDAGTINAEQAREMTSKAMTEEFQRQAGMQGLNPLNLLQAAMMQPGEEP